MSKKNKKKSDEKLLKLAVITALIGLIEKVIELIIKLLETFGGN